MTVEARFTWTCPNCGRHVPRTVDTCRCGYRLEPPPSSVAEADPSDAAPTPVHHGSVTVTWDDVRAAVADEILSEPQAHRLWEALAARAATRPRFDAAHVAYYAGAVIGLRDLIPPRARM